MNAKPGDICLFYNARGICRLITWFTKSRFYHVGIYDGDEHVVEARPSGVVRRDLQKANEHDYLVIPAPQNKGPEALQWARQQIGDNYDVPGVMLLVLERLFTNLHINYKPPRSRFSCGQFVLCAFQEAGIELLPSQEPEIAVPADFEVLLGSMESAKPKQVPNLWPVIFGFCFVTLGIYHMVKNQNKSAN
jgi:hypothetical protein